MVVCWSYPLGLVHTFRFSTGRELTGRGTAQLGTLTTSPVLIGRSNDPEICDQAVVNAQWPETDRNSIIALFFLYRRRKHRRNGLHWLHPVIQKIGKNSVPFTRYWINYETTKTSFLLFFSNVLFHLSMRCIPDWGTVFDIVNSSPPPMPPHVLMNFRGFPPGCGDSVADFWGWDAHVARLRCPDDVWVVICRKMKYQEKP